MFLRLQAAPALLQPHSYLQMELPALTPALLKAAEFGAEAEAIDAELE